MSYSLKHAEGELGKPLLGTEISDGFWAWQPNWFAAKQDDFSWIFNFTDTDPIFQIYHKDWIDEPYDRVFRSFPKKSVIIFVQDSL